MLTPLFACGDKNPSVELALLHITYSNGANQNARPPLWPLAKMWRKKMKVDYSSASIHSMV